MDFRPFSVNFTLFKGRYRPFLAVYGPLGRSKANYRGNALWEGRLTGPILAERAVNSNPPYMCMRCDFTRAAANFSFWGLGILKKIEKQEK